MRVRLLPLFLVAAVVAGLGVAIWHVMKPAPLPAEPPKVAAHSAEASAPSAKPDVEPASAPALVTPKRVSEAAKSGKHWWDGFVPGKKERVAQEEVAKQEEIKIAIDGDVVVVDGEGREHLDLRGTLTPGFYEPRPAKGADTPRVAAFVAPRFASRNGDEIAVENGRFHAEVPAGREFGATKLQVGGRFAVVDSEPVPVVAGRSVTIRAHWLAGVRVRVVDRASGAVLDDVEVAHHKQGGLWSSRDSDPGDADDREALVEHGHSPVLVPIRETNWGLETHAQVWIRAPDHAWADLSIDFEDRSERTVALVGAATLVVDVQGELPAPSPAPESGETVVLSDTFGEHRLRDEHERDPYVRLRKPPERTFDDVMKEALDHYDEAKPSDFPTGRKPTLDEFKTMIESMRAQFEAELGHGELVAERRARAGELRFESIAAQDLIATIEVGMSYRSPLVLASAPAPLVAGKTTRVALVAQKTEAPQPATLSGSIFVPRGWKLDKLKLEIEPVGLNGQTRSDEHRVPSRSWTPSVSRPGWYQWSAGTVTPATYAVRVDGAGIVSRVEVTAAGNPNVEIVLPDAAQLRVRVVAAADGKVVEIDHLSWSPVSEQETFMWDAGISLDRDASGVYSAQVPVGRGALASWGDESWEFDEQEVGADVHAGTQELVVRVHPTCGTNLELDCDGTKVPWDDLAFQIKIEKLDGSDASSWKTYRDGRAVLGARAPGRYRITLPEIAGYEPVAPFEIEIPAGEFLTKKVALRKR